MAESCFSSFQCGLGIRLLSRLVRRSLPVFTVNTRMFLAISHQCLLSFKCIRHYELYPYKPTGKDVDKLMFNTSQTNAILDIHVTYVMF